VTTPSGAATYSLSVEGIADDYFRVRRFRGHEAISEAYRFEIEVGATPGEDDAIEVSALGKRATFVWSNGGQRRAFYGVVAAVDLIDQREEDGLPTSVFRIKFVPRLWLLKKRKRTRVFQSMSVADVVTAVLAEWGIGVRLQLSHTYVPHEYCTQYEESDYRFILRLLAEAGIFFYFPAGPPVAGGTAGAAMDGVLGAVAAGVGSALGGAMGGVVGGLASSVASAAQPVLPGHTVVLADDAGFYPGIGGNDSAGLAATTASAIVSDVAGAAAGMAGLGGVAGDVVGAVAGAAASIAGNLLQTSAPPLYFVSILGTTLSLLDKITHFAIERRVRADVASFRDYDPARPLLRLDSSARSSVPPAASAVVDAVAAGVGALAGAVGGSLASTVSDGLSTLASAANKTGQLEVYDHDAGFLFPKWSTVRDEAPRILRQERRRAKTARGESGCPGLAPAHRFAVRNHFTPRVDGDYAVTRVEHRGQGASGAFHGTGNGQRDDDVGYKCSFACVPAKVTFLPPRPKRRSVQVCLTATVVGPKGEEIYVDAMGQIKVQFHWDREGHRDERSSCWIRTMHPWAGAGWGVQFIPRVGMEVIVVFEAGDPDRPLVIGSVANATHPTPFHLPKDKTRSGWRTQSSPGGSGHNELSFEDQHGKEQMYLHAQRDLDEVVLRNHTASVQGDERFTIEGSRIDQVKKDLHTRVDGDVAAHIGGSETVEVNGSRLHAVTGNVDLTVVGARTERVKGRDRLDVQDLADHVYADDLTTRVRGCMTTLVGKADKKRAWLTHAEGTATLSSMDRTEVSSEKELVLRVGDSAIHIKKDRIDIKSPQVTVTGGGGGMSASPDGLRIDSKGDAQIKVKEKLLLKTDGGASLSMDSEAALDGAKIKLGTAGQAKDAQEDKPPPPTTVTLVDEDGKPLPNARFVVVTDAGDQLNGVTDKDGKASMTIVGGGKIRFPDYGKVKGS
jgi:uncharacterized protein involved in type VI secretion and phage assembly